MELPGLVDLQVNGFGGIDFNCRNLQTQDVETVCRLLYAEGIVAFLPTLITNDLAEMESLAQTILAADDTTEHLPSAKILGLHLEGPFISPCPGAFGAHPVQWIRPPDFDWIRRIQDISQGRIRLLTFSPEWDGSVTFVKKVCRLGISVAIGHTMATPEQIADAVHAGAVLSTHLGNGIPAQIARHPNPIWSQLAEDRLWASLIGDGFHLPREVFQTILKVKKNKTFLVSDCTKFAGMKPGRYHSLIGGDVILSEESKLTMAENEHLLAGSAMSLRGIVETLVRRNWLPFEEAWELASLAPRRFLGEKGQPEIINVSHQNTEHEYHE